MADTFELRAEQHRNNEMKLTLLQRPARKRGEQQPEPVELVRMWGPPLQLAGEAISSILRDAGVSRGVTSLRPGDALDLSEALGTRLAVLMFALKPMRKLERIRTIAEAILNMSPEATCYWLSKATNGLDYNTQRRHMRALRILLAPE
ncbi:MAG: hypothetical protein U9R79_22510 [Armatimonadota bacterium]|nr:hypothetical protein [Armatimonadota bacterium]